MKYGLVGEHLSHSFSKEVHSRLSDYEYSLVEVPKDGIDRFFEQRDFIGINLTIPYKETVIPYLYYIDEGAKQIGAVNTVVNRDGRLYGYNTDLFGMCELIRHGGISLDEKKVLILGSGATSKTAYTAAKNLGAREIIKLSRTAKGGAITYEDAYLNHSDADIIINTTPVGTYPNIDCVAVDLSRFPQLSGVVDAVYNPLRSALVIEAKKRGIAAEGGLYMLVAQAVRASEIFLDTYYKPSTVEEVYKEILREKENIVLIGMPSSGKSTLGELLSERLGREFLDTDKVITKAYGKAPGDIISEEGEARFRDIECEAISTFAPLQSKIIATGGGAVLRDENIRSLKHNGKFFFIDRKKELLLTTPDRPLSKDRAKLDRLYDERYPFYQKAADSIIDNNGEIGEAVEKILEILR